MRAFVPGTKRQQYYPGACMAQLIIHRYAMLGMRDEQGYPLREMGILDAPREQSRANLMHGVTVRAGTTYQARGGRRRTTKPRPSRATYPPVMR